MISFKEYLTESRSAPLYHGTDINNLYNILLNKQGIIPRTYHTASSLLKHNAKKNVDIIKTFRKVNGVSATRDLNFALHFKGWTSKAVLVLDQRALSNRYEIRPIQYWQGEGYPTRLSSSNFVDTLHNNEYEEFIITQKPIPVNYITGIVIPSNLHPEMQKYIDVIRDTYGASFIKTV